jgi:phenylalanyl-tRNA synthetase beta subunit
LGAVQVGDTDLFVEITGTDMPSVTLAASIMACGLADEGFTIEPVRVDYEYDTPFGRSVVNPWYFQEPVFCSLARIEKFLGERIGAEDCLTALARMGVRARKTAPGPRQSGAPFPWKACWPRRLNTATTFSTPPENPEDLPNSFFTKRRRETLELPPEASGKPCYLAARYENSKGEAVPFGQLVEVIVP